jgi:hypothetical protein
LLFILSFFNTLMLFVFNRLAGAGHPSIRPHLSPQSSRKSHCISRSNQVARRTIFHAKSRRCAADDIRTRELSVARSLLYQYNTHSYASISGFHSTHFILHRV